MTEPKKSRIKDLTGQRFGRLVVVGLAPFRSKNRHVRWRCSCDCGNTTVVESTNLTSKHTKSCGCLKKEMLPNFKKRRREEIKKMMDAGVRRCSSCKSIKRIDQFSKAKSMPDGLHYTCKKCNQSYNRSDNITLYQAKLLLKRHAPVDIELPSELVEARAELIKIRRIIREMTK